MILVPLPPHITTCCRAPLRGRQRLFRYNLCFRSGSFASLPDFSNLWMDLQPDAHREAELEARRLQELQEEEKRRREEQLEKARVRGRQALKREQLVQVVHADLLFCSHPC